MFESNKKPKGPSPAGQLFMDAEKPKLDTTLFGSHKLVVNELCSRWKKLAVDAKQIWLTKEKEDKERLILIKLFNITCFKLFFLLNGGRFELEKKLYGKVPNFRSQTKSFFNGCFDFINQNLSAVTRKRRKILKVHLFVFV